MTLENLDAFTPKKKTVTVATEDAILEELIRIRKGIDFFKALAILAIVGTVVSWFI